jgi:O-succinylbenzoic acid--CoA ligase
LTGRDWLLTRAALTPDAPALETPSLDWTFAQLAAAASRGGEFVRAKAPPGDAPIALLLEGHATFAAWFHAIALAGRAVLPLNLRLTAGELARQIEDARVDWLLGEVDDPRLAALAGHVPGLRADPVPALEQLPAPSAALPGAVSESETLLAVLFTSGTTGRAKGACLSRGNFEASARAALECLGPAVRGRWLACMPLFHVGGLSILVRSLLFGGAVRLLPRFEAAEVSAALDAGDVEGVSLVPTMLSRLLDYRGDRPAPKGLRIVLLGGAAPPPGLVARALAAGYPVCPTYGLTEATSQVASAPPPPAGAVRTLPMRSLPGTELRILSDGRDAAPGEAGEIVLRGPTVMQGYLHRSEATARVLRDGWLHTGDIGLLDDDGGLQVLDRREDLIVSGGENVYPAEVESVLLEHPSVADAGVAGVPDADLGARVTAWIVPRPGVALDAGSLQRHCRERLAGFKQPREFHQVDALPRNEAGKLQRRRLARSGARY